MCESHDDKNKEEKDIGCETEKEYPVEQIPEDEAPTNKNVEKAVDELNPTVNSLGKR